MAADELIEDVIASGADRLASPVLDVVVVQVEDGVSEGTPHTAISDWLDPALGLAGCEPMVDRAAGLVETSSITTNPEK